MGCAASQPAAAWTRTEEMVHQCDGIRRHEIYTSGWEGGEERAEPSPLRSRVRRKLLAARSRVRLLNVRCDAASDGSSVASDLRRGIDDWVSFNEEEGLLEESPAAPVPEAVPDCPLIEDTETDAAFDGATSETSCDAASEAASSEDERRTYLLPLYSRHLRRHNSLTPLAASPTRFGVPPRRRSPLTLRAPSTPASENGPVSLPVPMAKPFPFQAGSGWQTHLPLR
eukprot:TRINITY_DN30514_c0_g1_i1.p1 TRINITY_DN30514_c0_g1~~TRINITY_DN30514_c0_g1_i1.p1  ORF type:complete len:227 (+),score=57.74 TRINITY_DN30514_c0_g1_i1:60-740(+)